MAFDFLKKLRGDNNIIKPPITAPAAEPVTTSADSGTSGKMVVDDVFTISGRGTVVTGRVESGTFRIGQDAVVQTSDNRYQTKIKGIEAFRKTLDEAHAGDNCGLLLDGISREQISQGAVITAV